MAGLILHSRNSTSVSTHTQTQKHQQPASSIVLKRKLLRLSTAAYLVHIPERNVVVTLPRESCSHIVSVIRNYLMG